VVVAPVDRVEVWLSVVAPVVQEDSTPADPVDPAADREDREDLAGSPVVPVVRVDPVEEGGAEVHQAVEQSTQRKSLK